MTRIPALAAVLAVAAAAAPAASPGYFAAGFSGAYERSVLLSETDEVIGCRAVGRIDEKRAVTLERRRDATRTSLAILSDRRFDEAERPHEIVVGASRFPIVNAFDGRDFLLEISADAERAILERGAAALGYGELVVPLPADGLPQALAFTGRCALL